jgi:hypothetical protein
LDSGTPDTKHDLEDIGPELVTVTLVAAPFDAYQYELLNKCFSRGIHLKPHYVADLSQPMENIVRKSHLDTVARALKKIEVSYYDRPEEGLIPWIELFDVRVKRHIMVFSLTAKWN